MDADDAALWNARYSGPEYLFGEAANDFIAEECWRIGEGARVLSVGEGEGRNAVHLAMRGAQVTALDVSSVALARAAALAKNRDVSLDLLETDIASWRPSAPCYDVVIWVFVHLPPEKRATAHASVWAALRPGGLLIGEVFDAERLDEPTIGPRRRDMRYAAEDLQALHPRAEVLHMARREVELNEGSRHRGRAAVLDFILRHGGA